MIPLALMQWLGKNWLPLLIAAVVAGVIITIMALRSEVAGLKRDNADLKASVAAATAQANLAGNVANAVDVAATKEATVTVKTERAVDAVQHANGASDAVPAPVAAAWGAGIDGMRSDVPTSPADGQRAGEPQGNVSAPR